MSEAAVREAPEGRRPDPSPAPRPGDDAVASVVAAYRTVHDEVDLELPCLEGALPDGLRGFLYRNGAGKIEVGATQQMHPFDGDGMVSRFAIGEGRVHYRNRYVRTREYLEEEAAGRMLYRAFGTNRPGGLISNLMRMRFKNAANTSVVWHGGRLLALWEAGQPHALDPETLATLGRHDFDGALSNRFPERLLFPELPFSAHPTVCPRTGELFNFGLLIGPRTELLLHRVPASGGPLTTWRYPLDQATFMHDFALTERHAVFFSTPVRFDVARTLAGLTTPVEAIRQAPGVPTEILLIPRGGGEMRRFSAPSGFFLFHYFGAYEDGDRVVVHGCRMPGFAGGTVDLRDPAAIWAAPFELGELARWTVDLSSGAVDEHRFGGARLELPTLDPRFVTRRHRVGWGTARLEGGPPVLTGLARVDLESGRSEVRDLSPDLPGEPIFVPRAPDAAEGEGWLLSVMYRAETGRSELWVLDAERLTTVARFGLPHHQPPGFHGCFVDAPPA